MLRLAFYVCYACLVVVCTFFLSKINNNIEYFTISPLISGFAVLTDVEYADQCCGISNKPSYYGMVAIDNTIEITVKGTTKGSDLASDELVCVLYERIASGLTTYGVLRHNFVTSVLLYFVTYSYYCRLVVSLEDDVSETRCVSVLQN